MKSFSKFFRIMVAALALTVAFSFAGNTVSAKKKKKATLFVGEKVQLYTIGIGSLKSVKSSKKSVCSASKDNGNAIISAKKSGKATITLKGSSGKLTYSVTVKGNPFKLTYTKMAKGVAVKAENKSNIAFDSVRVNATFYDAAGNPVTQETGTIYYIGPKQKAYTDVVTYNNSNIDLSKTQVSVINADWTRSLNYKAKGYSKNVKTSIKEESGKVKLYGSTKYKGKGNIQVACDIAYKDASGNIIGLDSQFFLLYKNKKVDTSYGSTKPTGTASYEILSKRIYLQTWSN